MSPATCSGPSYLRKVGKAIISIIYLSVLLAAGEANGPESPGGYFQPLRPGYVLAVTVTLNNVRTQILRLGVCVDTPWKLARNGACVPGLQQIRPT